jgi:tetratricopeptide (TPR) repeat protein
MACATAYAMAAPIGMFVVFAFVVLVAQPFRAAQNDPSDFGRIEFPTSGSAKARRPFLRGVAALHSFEYEEALDAFREAEAIDPGFAMAYWGEAMSYNRALWAHEDRDAATRALAHLGPTAQSRAARAPTAREKGYLEAVENLFGDGDKPSRDRRYADAMRRLSERFPHDHEAACFYALAMLATAERGLQGIADDEEHRHALAGSDVQRRAAAILQKVLKENPRHPGAAHYLIHAWDDPEHASLALPIARTYAGIAPAASHARHMPAHVFFQLGLWDEAAASDQAAWAASEALVRRKNLPLSMRSYHSLSWLQYASLQQGRRRHADWTLTEIESVAERSGDPGLKGIAASMRARAVVETGRWTLMRGRTRFDNNDELFAIGASAARTGDVATARMAQQELARRAAAPHAGDRRPLVAILEREIAALIELADGRGSQAIAPARDAVDAERRLPAIGGLPPLVKPPQELLGEILLELGRPREAAAAFEGALQRYRNRSASVLGLARALAASGAQARAREQYRRFLASWRRADPNQPELAEARRAAGGARRGTGARL